LAFKWNRYIKDVELTKWICASKKYRDCERYHHSLQNSVNNIYLKSSLSSKEYVTHKILHVGQTNDQTNLAKGHITTAHHYGVIQIYFAFLW